MTRTLCAIALLFGIVVSAQAQGLYYKEIQKETVIYIFNVAANAERFEKTGEMPASAITMKDAGRNGETLIGDNERALQLYFFQNKMSVAVPEKTPPAVVWRDGKLRLTTENAYLEVSNRVQVRYTHEFPDGNTQLPGTVGPGDSRGSFRIRRAKFKLEGWMLRPWLTFETQLNYPAVTGSNPGALLEDAAFDIDFTKGRGLFRAHVGQFKPPYGAQEMTSSGNQQFVDRALSSNNYFRGRETGIALWGATTNNKLEWRVGMFNGNGLTRTVNDNDKFQYNARLLIQPNGSQALNQRAWVTGALYSESDFESTKAPIYAFALNFERQNNFNATAGNDLKWNAVSIDWIYKFKGFSTNGMYTLQKRTAESGAESDSQGGFVQAGYLFGGRRYEIAARYGMHDPTDATPDNDVKETRVAFSYYYARHGLKWQTDFGATETGAGPLAPTVKAKEVRSQLQFVF